MHESVVKMVVEYLKRIIIVKRVDNLLFTGLLSATNNATLLSHLSLKANQSKTFR